MTTPTQVHPLPTRAQLLKASALSLLIAGIVLVVAVLPAEHGIDPTGLGRSLGLLGMSAKSAAPVTPAAPAAAGSANASAAPDAIVRNEFVVQNLAPFRSGEMRVVLEPDRGAEIKARMARGDRFTFGWSSSQGPVEFDMHGEEVNAAKDVFTSYWKADAASGQGTFTAPFDGSHGWYWHNHGTLPVTITVRVSGFYSELYRP